MTTQDTEIAAIREALETITPGEWKWFNVTAPNWMPDTHRAAGDLRVQTPAVGKSWDYDLAYVIQPLKHGSAMVRNADADFIANAPDYMRTLLARLDDLEAALKEIASHTIDKHYWGGISDRQIASECETAHDDLVAIAQAALGDR